jgi:hypothetical protein
MHHRNKTLCQKSESGAEVVPSGAIVVQSGNLGKNNLLALAYSSP